MKYFSFLGILLSLLVVMISCAKDQPFLSGYIRRAADAVLAPCDPYNKGDHHSCLVFSSASRDSLYIYDATASELILAPIGFFPLKVKVGHAVDELVVVNAEGDRFPYFLALDKAAPSISAINLFPSSDGKSKSFATPKINALNKAPQSIAAFLQDNQVFLLMSYPDESHIKIMAMDKENGVLDTNKEVAIPCGKKPGRIAIDNTRQKAVVSDADDDNIRIIHLNQMANVLQGGSMPSIDVIPVGAKSESIAVQYRDFGQGLELYALVFNTQDKNINLINLDTKSKASLSLPEDIMAAYLPDQDSSLHQQERHWLSLVTLKGNLHYISVTQQGADLKLANMSTIDLTSEDNLALGKVMFRKIVGGAILQDNKIDRERICASNRQTFYITSYGNRKSYLNSEPHEVEALGYSCEGESSASRFGFKTR